jgi:hypothetical protein
MINLGQIILSNLAEAVILPTCIQDVPTSNLSQDTTILPPVFCEFPQALQKKCLDGISN